MKSPELLARFHSLKAALPDAVTLVAISKGQPADAIYELYNAGQRIFGENKVQELLEKKKLLPGNVQWHFIGHLQTNKVAAIVPFIHLIHSLDSEKLAAEIDRQAKKNNRIIGCLMEIRIAAEETKYGFSFQEAEIYLLNTSFHHTGIRIMGLMGMASNVADTIKIRDEFRNLFAFYKQYEQKFNFRYLSMGMSSDFKIAIEEGSNMVRIGSVLF
jgi:PLP dependent protein